MDWGIIAILIAGLIGALEVVSILVVRHDIQSYKDQLEERGDMGDQLDEWLLAPESEVEGAPTKLEAYATFIGKTLYKSTHMAKLQEGSVEARVQNKYDGMVETAIRKKQPLEWKIAQKALDYLDIDIDLLEIAKNGELGNLRQSFDKYGVNPNSAGSSNQM